jgi:peptide deformylase
MAILKIARMGHPVLQHKAADVDDPMAPEIQKLIENMSATLDDVGGIGLAAPQVHEGQRVVIYYEPGATDDEDAKELTVLINPVIEPIGDEKEVGWESCLSLPGLTGAVPRHTQIRYTGMTQEGELFEREAQGFHARVLQHECDHLDGILYPMRMANMAYFGFTEEMRERGSPAGSEGEEPEKSSEGEDQ